MKSRLKSALVASLLLLPAGLRADAPPASKAAPASQPATFLVGEMHLQTLPAQQYLFSSSTTTFEKMAEPIGKTVPPLVQAWQEGKLGHSPVMLFVYHDVGEDMSKPFTLDVGAVVPKETAGFGDFKVRGLGEYRCATALYTGPLSSLGKAYAKLMPAVFVAGLLPTGEAREAYLYWESPESPNNVVQIQVAVKPAK